MSGQLPFAGRQDSSVIIEVVVKKSQPSRPEFGNNFWRDAIKDEMWNLLKWCFAYAPSERPGAREVKEA
ncbi:hypothetical protein FRC11_003295, partial [Ceratobasidium sp. 423]